MSKMATAPPMDDHVIGPAGQTLGELKQGVVHARQAFLETAPDSAARDRLAEELSTASGLLRAAYTRMGLKPVAP